MGHEYNVKGEIEKLGHGMISYETDEVCGLCEAAKNNARKLKDIESDYKKASRLLYTLIFLEFTACILSIIGQKL
ncbi:hypothetical protein [Bartonella australis]|uniref:hypothetical protein n=1 Tax=Bartonella australis TaxID=388640 RepID=UPI0005A2B6D4|nr:hypothetical protein [Bartonella australis]